MVLRRLLPTSTAIALALLLAACGSASEEPAAEPQISDEAATLDSTTAPTAPAETTTTVAAAPVGLFSPEESAQALYDAWKADDRATAATLAVPAAVDGQWATAPGDYAVYNRCDSAEFDTSGCLFRGAGGTIQYTMEKAAGDRWIVTAAFFSAP